MGNHASKNDRVVTVRIAGAALALVDAIASAYAIHATFGAPSSGASWTLFAVLPVGIGAATMIEYRNENVTGLGMAALFACLFGGIGVGTLSLERGGSLVIVGGAMTAIGALALAYVPFALRRQQRKTKKGRI